jgi:hypothetical protein
MVRVEGCDVGPRFAVLQICKFCRCSVRSLVISNLCIPHGAEGSNRRKRLTNGEITMFKTTNRLRAVGKNPTALGGIRRRLGAALSVSVAALACTAFTGPAFAASPYDGGWSVMIMTRSGPCDPSIRYGVQIDNGRVIAGNGAASVQGHVNRAGAVRVMVQSGNASALGSGRLGRVSGGGVWHGQGASGACAGTWVAQRAGYGAQAEGPGAPVYNFAPEAAGPGTSACAMRHRSYDPATGTFVGYDGLRHPCR